MDKVTPIRPPTGWLENKAKCLTCRHEWHAVAPVGTTWFECPACGLHMGRFMRSVNREGAHWHCLCGNDLFYINLTVTYCAVCGKIHESFF